jgi:ABC-2 type transport system ATP-binding protein
VLDVGMRRPTLDDVFLTLTGRVTDDDAIAQPTEAQERQEVTP